MKRFKNLLYVCEPSVDQAPAVARVLALAADNQAKLTLLTVAQTPRLGPFAATHTVDEVESAIRERELQLLTSLLAPYSAKVRPKLEVRFGIAFIEVIQEVLRNRHDLVLKPASVGPEGREPWFGSGDMHLLRKCPSPVWIMKPSVQVRYRRVLAAVDFDPWEPRSADESLNDNILELAACIALDEAAELHVIHVWEAVAESIMWAWASDLNKRKVAEYVESERRRHQQGLEVLSGRLRDRLGKEAFDRLSPRLHLPSGDAREVIAAQAADLNADLVVMGTVARTGIRGLIIGNTAEGILNRIGCSVLAVKPEDFVSPVVLEE